MKKLKNEIKCDRCDTKDNIDYMVVPEKRYQLIDGKWELHLFPLEDVSPKHYCRDCFLRDIE